MEIEKIEHNGKRLAFIIRKNAKMEAKNFPSPGEDFLQIGYMELEKGDKIEPHIHKIWERIVNKTQKVIYVIFGKIRINFYENKKKIKEAILEDGDLIVLLEGGFGFEILEKSRYIEVKQGPYVDVNTDKIKFDPVDEWESTGL
jgi:hypothetical protein